MKPKNLNKIKIYSLFVKKILIKFKYYYKTKIKVKFQEELIILIIK